MDLEPTVDQSGSETSSVKLNKDVKNYLLKRAHAKLADLFQSEPCIYTSEKPHQRPCYWHTIVHPTRAHINRTPLAGVNTELKQSSTEHFIAEGFTLKSW